jgi:biotin transport system substrate-specific component
MKNTSERRIYSMLLAALLAGLTAVLAFIAIPLPFSPVPVTGQTFGVMLGGTLLGPRIAATGQIVYLLLGVLGLPVFSGGTAGLGVLFGPTGGYAWAFVPGAYVAGYMAGNRPTLARTFFATVTGGIVVIYLLGAAQLSLVTRLGMHEVLAVGVLPFLPGDVVKAIAASLVATRLRPHLKSP